MSGKISEKVVLKADNQMRNRNYPEYGVDSSGGRVGGDCVVVVMLVMW